MKLLAFHIFHERGVGDAAVSLRRQVRLMSRRPHGYTHRVLHAVYF